jgi:hypothetical protein
MKFSYTLTFTDYIAAIRLDRFQRLGKRVIFILFCIASLAVLLIVGQMVNVFFTDPDVFIYVVWIPLSLLTIPIKRSFNTRRGFRRLIRPLGRNAIVSIDIDEVGFRSGIPGVSEAKVFWESVVDFVQNEKVTLIYINKSRFHSRYYFFPTNVLSLAQRSELNDLVARHVVKRKP